MKLKKYRFLISRRIVQFTVLILFAGSSYLNWKILTGNLSSALFLNTIHLSDPFAFLQILSTGFISSTNVLIGALTVFTLYVVIGGRVFCSWVCPVNWLTDLGRWIGIKMNLNKTRKLSVLRTFRYWILVMSFVLSAILGMAAFEVISPIGILHRNIIFGLGSGTAIILFIFLMEVAVLKNGWCGHLCPLGAFYAIISRFGFLRVKHNVEKCTDCMDCFKVCPEVQVLSIVTKESGVIHNTECTNCGRCIEVCPDDALKFGNKYKKSI